MFIADYSQVTGGKILPFQVEFDTLRSVLNPDEGSYQKFSYTVTAKGGNSNAENLTGFILGIDQKITADQLKNMSVIINGKNQDINFGTSGSNVRFANADASNGCSGLRFDFGLNRNNGTMQISFELETPYGVDLIPVCLAGSSGVKTGLSIGGPLSLPETDENTDQDEKDGNEKDMDQDKNDQDKKDEDEKNPDNCFNVLAGEKFDYRVIDFSVPVSIKPYAITHEPELKCLGDVKIDKGSKFSEKNCEEFDFTITQKVSIKTPVEFGIKATFEELCVEECEDDEENR